MKIISIKSYRNGYTGIFEEDDRYVLFNLAKNGKLKKINEYNKEEYIDYNHFVGLMSKFIPRSSFLKETVQVESITIEELDRVFLNPRSLDKSLMHEPEELHNLLIITVGRHA